MYVHRRTVRQTFDCLFADGGHNRIIKFVPLPFNLYLFFLSNRFLFLFLIVRSFLIRVEVNSKEKIRYEKSEISYGIE